MNTKTNDALTKEAYIALVRQQNEKAQAEGKTRYVYVLTFGCQQNEADSERLLGTALAMGYHRCHDPALASLILVNTCAIREHAEQKALSLIGQYKHIRAANPELLIGVCGCMTAQEHRVKELKEKYPYVSFTLEPSEMSMLPEAVYRCLTEHKRLFLLGESRDNIGEGMPVCRESRTRAWLSVMYGCNNFCTYCIVPYVRDRERSRSADAILSEAKELVAGGAKEITLLGQNVNSYRGECDFAELLSRVAQIDGDFLVRFMTSHPKDASEKLFDVMATHERVAKQFHLPMQSGSDRILRAMNRRYDGERYLSLVDGLRSRMPDITLSSDIIVGFPGETEEDFEQTLGMLRRIRFDMVYSFIYSPRKGTPAAQMPEQIPREVQGQRMDRLLELQTQISLEKNEALIGRTLRVLCDGRSKNDPGMLAARTEGNKLVHFPSDGALCDGQYVDVKITGAEPFGLRGELLK